MEIRFLGTGAADWSSDLKGEDEYRRFSSVLVNNTMLIDPGPHIFDYAKDFGCENIFDNAEDILITHSHDDHLNLENLQKLCRLKKRRIWCEKNVAAMVKDICNMEITVISQYQNNQISGFNVIAVPANHITATEGEQAFNYIIEQDKERIFYGCDGAWLRCDTWNFIKETEFDMMIFDGTLGDGCGDYRIFEHNNLKMVELIVETVRKTGVIKKDGKLIISHLSYEAQEKHSEVVKRLKPVNVDVAYDGLVIKL